MIRSFTLLSAVLIALIRVAEAAAGGVSESLRVPAAMLDRVEKDLAAARPVIESVSLKALPSLTFASGKHIDTSRRTSLEYDNRILPELVKLLRHERSLGGMIMLVDIVGTIDESLGDMSLELKEYSDFVYERHEARTRSQPASTDSVARCYGSPNRISVEFGPSEGSRTLSHTEGESIAEGFRDCAGC